MADNFSYTPGSGETGAADDIDGVKYPRIKMIIGANNTNDGDISATNPMPVTGTLTAVTAITNALPAGTNAIGKLAANSGVDIGDVDVASSALPTGASTSAKQDTIIGHVDGIESLLTTIDADTSKIPSQGQALAAASMPVVLPEAQITTLTPPAAITGFATAAKQLADGHNVTLAAGTALAGKFGIDQATANANEVVTKSGSVTTATLSAETTKVIGTVNVAAAQTIAVTNAGTFATQATLQAGTAGIGKLTANSGVDIGDVDVASIAAGDNNIGNVDIASALPAGTNLLGRTSASNETSTVYNGTTALTPKYAVIDAATSGNNTLVSAVADKKIRVLALWLVSAGTVNTRFESGADGTALTGQANLIVNTGFVLPYNPVGWFETGSNTLLNLELSAAVSCDGSLVYVEV